MKTAFWRQMALTLTFVALASTMAFAQGGRGQRGGGGPGGFGGGPGGFRGFGGLAGGGDAALALREEVQKELDLSDDQVEELRDLQRNSPNMFQMMRDLGGDFRSMSQEEREDAMASIRKKLEKANTEASEDVLDVMKSKQKDRFEELKFQYAISQGNLVGALTGADIDVDDDERKELTELQQKVNQELQKKISELRMKMYVAAMADSDLISESKVEKLMGDLFTFEAGRSRFGGFGGGPPGGGRGQRGGGAAGRQRGGRQRGGEDGGNRRRGGGEEEDGDANPRRRRPN